VSYQLTSKDIISYNLQYRELKDVDVF